MIVPNQTNLKVHFAGHEHLSVAMIHHRISKIRYSLFTVFPFIAHKVGIKALRFEKYPSEFITRHLEEGARHTILDSGLYTLLFGAHAAKRDEDFFIRWQEAIVEFVLTTGYKGTIVEVDCQKILGPEKAWMFRENLKKICPNRQINVFHIEDGQKGLDRLIEFSNYIAIGVTGIKRSKRRNKKNWKDDVIRLCHYIKNKKPSIDIHLLGVTHRDILQGCNFVSSVDSTTWMNVHRYGLLSYYSDNRLHNVRKRNIKSEIVSERYHDEIKEILEYLNIEVTSKKIDYYSTYALTGQLLKKQYGDQAGDQE